MSFKILNNGWSPDNGTQSCDGCVFYYPILNKCDLGRREKLLKYDSKRFCNLYRDEVWQSQYWNGGQPLEHRVYEESRLPFDLIVYDEDGADKDAYLDFLEDLNSESFEGIAPRQIIFVVNNNVTKIPEVGDAIRKEENRKHSIPQWKIKHFLSDSDTFESCVDAASKECKSPFMMVMSIHYVLPLGTFSKIDDLYNNQFKPIALITEGTGNFYMVNRLLFESLGRNAGTYPDGSLTGNAIDKITQQAHKENRADRLWDLGDILNV